MKAAHFLNFILFFLVVLLALNFGDTHFGLKDLFANSVGHSIVVDLRAIRVGVCFASGAALAVAGSISQAVFQNPLATPTVLGTAAGASFGAVLCFMLTGSYFFATTIGATVGAVLAALALYYFMTRNKNSYAPADILLFGVGINTFFSALSMLCISILLSKNIQIPDIMYWLFGDTSGKSWTHVIVGTLGLVCAWFVANLYAKQIDRLNLGYDLAQTLGVPVKKTLLILIGVVSVCVGMNMYLTGFIPFVGLVVPMIARKIVGNRFKNILLFSLISGGTLTIVADLIIRTLFASIPIQIGALTALIGGPVFIYLMFSDQRLNRGIK